MDSVITYSTTIDSSTSGASAMDDTQDELEMIKQELKPFAQALTEDIEKKPICKATAYEIAIAMIADIVIKILDYQEKKIIFPKKVITGLWSIQSKEHTINLIGLLYQFMTICGSYPDANFKKSTYGATISKKPSADINYSLDPKQAYIPLKDCKFALLLKVFRTIIGRSINNTTGSYSIPSEENSDKWRFMIIDANKTHHFLTSQDFIEYTLEIGQVYGELDKLSPPLSEIYEIFNEAATASKLEKEQKMQLKEARLEARALYLKKSHHYNEEKRQQFVEKNIKKENFGFVSAEQKIDWKKIDANPPPPSVWKKNVHAVVSDISPINQNDVYQYVVHDFVQDFVQDIIQDNEFQVVKSRRNKKY